EDFMFQITRNEFKILRSQFATSSWGGRRYLPYVFTEQGVAMLSSVLNSERAILVNIGIMRVFVNIRKLVSTNKGILIRLNRLEDKVQSHDKKIRTIFEVIHKPSDTKLLSPGKPFSNKKAVRDIIISCNKYIYWVDKYFSRAGLDWLSESLNTSKVKNVKILMAFEKLNEKFISLYKDLKEELKNDGVRCELRVITDNKLKIYIHDRWIISENLCYNMPSTDTVARGQYSEVKRTTNSPPFDEWWNKSEDIEKIGSNKVE
ncbi:MAG: ORF6N domain-containing protein, partial [Elusimicrobiota bacterium]